MALIHRGIQVIRAWRRAYIILNLVYYGLVIVMMTYAVFNRSLQQELVNAIGVAVTEGPLSTVGGAYLGGEFWRAVGLTFVINLTVGSFVSITLPSLVIPFSGLLIAEYRAALWGVIFSPTLTDVGARHVVFGLFAALLILLEGQAYVLAMLAAYIHGRAWLRPSTVGAGSRRDGYVAGLRRSVAIYALVSMNLAIAAVYEALVVIIFPSAFG